MLLFCVNMVVKSGLIGWLYKSIGQFSVLKLRALDPARLDVINNCFRGRRTEFFYSNDSKEARLLRSSWLEESGFILFTNPTAKW